jgi:hypothetical protein
VTPRRRTEVATSVLVLAGISLAKQSTLTRTRPRQTDTKNQNVVSG